MRIRFETVGPLVLTLSLSWACSGPSITPDPPPASFTAMCMDPPTFRMTVQEGNTTPVISLTNGYLIVNGEALRMTRTAGRWGPYIYQGNVPFDGEVRYRYMFRYTSGLASGGTDQAVFAPSSYVVRPMGSLTWSSPVSTPGLRDDDTDETLFRRPRRWISMWDVFPDPSGGFSGNRSQTAELVMHNGYAYPISLSAPTLVDRQTGAAIPGLTIAHSSGLTSGYVLHVVDGHDEHFKITAQTTITNSHSVLWEAGVKFPVTIGATTCWFGPIWVDVAFFSNPS